MGHLEVCAPPDLVAGLLLPDWLLPQQPQGASPPHSLVGLTKSLPTVAPARQHLLRAGQTRPRSYLSCSQQVPRGELGAFAGGLALPLRAWHSHRCPAPTPFGSLRCLQRRRRTPPEEVEVACGDLPACEA